MKMNKKTIELEDGRYLIYYTFSDKSEEKNKAPQNDGGAE